MNAAQLRQRDPEAFAALVALAKAAPKAAAAHRRMPVGSGTFARPPKPAPREWAGAVAVYANPGTD
jgi:hypothetical protein